MMSRRHSDLTERDSEQRQSESTDPPQAELTADTIPEVTTEVVTQVGTQITVTQITTQMATQMEEVTETTEDEK